MKLNLNPNILTVFDEISDHGFLVGIIGGFCRDFLLDGVISNDIDLEIRPLGEIDTTELYEYLKSKYNAKILNYNILTLDVGHYSIEMGLPRVEKFNSEVGHSNFDATFIADLDYTRGFKRRDFTINAIMFLYESNQWSIIDPLGGVEDLGNKELVQCDEENFSKDPVRCLRALRFSLKLNFSLNPYLSNQLVKFNPDTVTSHYLKLESQKSLRPITFLASLFNLQTLFDNNKCFKEKVENRIKLDPQLRYSDKQLLSVKLGLSKKGILKFDLNQSIFNLVDKDPEGLDAGLKVMQASDLSDSYLSYILDHYFSDLNLKQFKTFTETQYDLTEEDKKNNPSTYRHIILKRKLERSC